MIITRTEPDAPSIASGFFILFDYILRNLNIDKKLSIKY